MKNAAKTQELENDVLPEEEESSRKVGWFATLAILSLLGLVVWFVFNSSDEA